MEKVKANQVLEILEYWKLIEFLGQIDIPEESSDNKKLIEKIRNGEKVSEGKVEIFMDVVSPYIEIEKLPEQNSEEFRNYSTTGDEITFCLGKIERNSVVEYLEKFIEEKEERPEIVYPKKSTIAWCSFKTDMEGLYLQESFQLSPILWAISVWEKTRMQKQHDFFLDINEYNDIVSKIDKELQEQNVSQFLASVYEQIFKNYIKKQFPDVSKDTMGFIAYNRYTNDEVRDGDEDATDYADLGKSFFLSDIIQLSNLISSDKFGDGNDYEKTVIAYILSGYEKAKGLDNFARTIISPRESLESMKVFFENILNVENAPMGKWPAKFMPALMQQVAVNIAIRQDGNAPIFSVNGPPGTGKTTLLKEIVASNIVERALLLAKNGEEPDTLFEKHSFAHGPLVANGNAYYRYAPNYYSIKDDGINNYSMLVASCNNAAVENITIDLPKGKDILESLESSEGDEEDIIRGLREIHDLFDVEKSEDIETITQYGKSREEKDIYFTRYANKLLGVNDCWGLVSAPFGKRANIRKYCNAVLKPFIEEYKSNDARELHKTKFVKQREQFLRQYELVDKLKKELAQLCKLTKEVPLELQSVPFEKLSQDIYEIEGRKQTLGMRLNSEQRELMELEESRPRGLFARFKDTSTRDSLIQEKRDNIESIKAEIRELEARSESVKKLQEYQEILSRYSKGEKKMTR